MESQCLGAAEALSAHPIIKRVHLKSPWRQLSPWLRFGHEYALTPDSDPIGPPYPDLIIASGRKSIGVALHIKKKSDGKTFLVQLQDPRIDPKNFDLVVVSEHDPARGENVIVTTGALHRVTPQKIAAEKAKFATKLEPLPQPRVAVLIGGNSQVHRMTPEITKKLAQQLLELKTSLMVTASRRTGPENEAILRDMLKGPNVYFWDGKGDNPYFALLGYADYIVATEDSVSMVSEALSTGKPVLIAPLEGGSKRFQRFHQMLQEQGLTKPFTGLLKMWSYTPLQDTIKVTDEIRRRMKMKE